MVYHGQVGDWIGEIRQVHIIGEFGFSNRIRLVEPDVDIGDHQEISPGGFWRSVPSMPSDVHPQDRIIQFEQQVHFIQALQECLRKLYP